MSMWEDKIEEMYSSFSEENKKVRAKLRQMGMYVEGDERRNYLNKQCRCTHQCSPKREEK